MAYISLKDVLIMNKPQGDQRGLSNGGASMQEARDIKKPIFSL